MYIIAVLMATLLWGVWPLFHKVSLRTLHPLAAQLILSWSSTIMATTYFLMNKSAQKLDVCGVSWAVIAGVATSGAMLAYSYAASQEDVSIVISLTAINPAIAFLLAVLLLGETFTFSKFIGLCFILLGTIVVMLAK